MPWRFSRMSWSSWLFFKNKLKYYASASITTWPATTLKSGFGHVMHPLVTTREMQVFSTFDRWWEEGACGWRWHHCLTPHPAKEGGTPDTEASLWTPTFNKHPEPVRLPHQFALASYCKLLSHSVFLPPHNFPPQLPLLILSDFSIIKLPCHFFERQKVSPQIQDLPSGPETAVTQWKTGLLKQLWDGRGNPKSTLSCHILSEVKPAFNKNHRGGPSTLQKVDVWRTRSPRAPKFCRLAAKPFKGTHWWFPQVSLPQSSGGL